MDDLKKSVATLNKLLAQRDEIQRKQAEVSAALDGIAGEQQALGALRQERKKALGKAVIEGKKPDTADLDKQIAAAEKRIAAAGDNKTANEAAAAQLEETFEAVEAGIEQARENAHQAAVDIVSAQFDAGVERYAAACVDLRKLALHVVAANTVLHRLGKNRWLQANDLVISAASVDQSDSVNWGNQIDQLSESLVSEIFKSLADAGWQA